ncbi:MAG: hypothetical protein ACD_9C00258G0005 [uncultured bacterium]|nr:MAG: hypothetical protein ACD_9C00258G0005 [uncultured bacterium]
MTTIIAIYGAILSTAIFVHSLWQKRDRLKISYSRVDINNKYYWSFDVINISQRSIFIKNFWFQCGDTAKAVIKNCEDLDNIDTSEILELNPNRALEVLYSEGVLKINDINPRSFFVEEENGEKYFLERKYYNRKKFKAYMHKIRIK